MGDSEKSESSRLFMVPLCWVAVGERPMHHAALAVVEKSLGDEVRQMAMGRKAAANSTSNKLHEKTAVEVSRTVSAMSSLVRVRSGGGSRIRICHRMANLWLEHVAGARRGQRRPRRRRTGFSAVPVSFGCAASSSQISVLRLLRGATPSCRRCQ